jgi:hypothetical protein
MFPRVIVHAQSNQVAGAVIAPLVNFNAMVNIKNPCGNVPATLAAAILVTAPDVLANDLHSPVIVIAYTGFHGQRE